MDIFSPLKAFFWWIVEQISGLLATVSDAVMGMLTGALGALGGLLELDTAAASAILSFANYWVPIDLSLALLGMEISYALARLAVRAFIKFIPKIGG